MGEMKMVIVARKDLKLGQGKLAAQVAHGAVDCAIKAQRYQPATLRTWLEEGQRKVVVKAPDQETLFRLKMEAERAGLTTSIIADAGRTQLAPGTVTVLAIGPADERELDKITGELALF